MAQRPVTGRVTRRWRTCWSGLRADLDDLLRRVQPQGCQDVALGLGQLGGLPEGPGRAGVGDRVQALELGADPVPGPGSAWRWSPRRGSAAGRASTAGRGRVSGPRAGGRRAAGQGPASCRASRAQGESQNACIGDHCSGNAPVIGIDSLLALAAAVRRLRVDGGGPGEDGAECTQGLPCPRSQGSAEPGSGVGGAAGGEPGGGGMPDGGTDDADDPGGAGRPGRGRA